MGGGGHAKVVIDCLKNRGVALPVAVLDRDTSLWGKELLGVPILGGDDLIEDLKQKGVGHFVVGVGGVGDNSVRRRVFEEGLSHGLVPLTVVHPSAVCSTSAAFGGGTVVLAGAVVNVGAVLGDNVIINTGAIVDHDCVIGDHVHIAPGVTLSGNVKIGSGAHIGTGASIRQNIHIGENSIVGAGSAVVQDVPANVIVKGVPAK